MDSKQAKGRTATLFGSAPTPTVGAVPSKELDRSFIRIPLADVTCSMCGGEKAIYAFRGVWCALCDDAKVFGGAK